MIRTLSLGVVAVLVLAACGDAEPVRKADMAAWQGAEDPFMAPGWKAGDKASWEKQMKLRAQAQNEYVRASVQ
jgi:hypothetical protein